MRIRFFAMLFALVLLAFSAAACAEQENMEHYLILGADEWGVSEEGSARSDAIVLTTLDYGNDRVVFTSISRDSVVKPGFRKDSVRINALVRSSEGEQVLIDYLEAAYGLKISGYFVINFSGAVDIINAIDGVTIELSQDEVDYINYHAGEYDGYPLQAGDCLLNGAQTVCYMRCRKLDNVFGRQTRHANVFHAVMEKVRGLSLLKAATLFDEVMGMYRSSLTVTQQAALIYRAAGLLDGQVETYSLPAEGTYRYGTDKYGTSGLLFDIHESRLHLYNWLGILGPGEFIDEKPVDHSHQAGQPEMEGVAGGEQKPDNTPTPTPEPAGRGAQGGKGGRSGQSAGS